MAFQIGTATDYVDLLNKLLLYVTSNHVATAVVSAGGTGYTVGDILTASGGTFSQAAQFEVLTVSSGVITLLRIFQHGAYTSNPSSPVSTTGGTGTGATVTVTFVSAEWSKKRESEEALSATVSAGGSSYAVNDILTVSGGQFVGQAQFKVTAVSSGAVTAVALWTRGNYWQKPSNPASTTGGGGTGCTLTVTYQGVLLRTTQHVVSATVAAGGTGYTAGDILSLSGGTSTVTAQFRVTTVSSGAVTAVVAHTRGDYSVIPGNPVSTTGGTGTGATLNVTWELLQPLFEKELIIEGVGSGSDQLFVGIRTFTWPANSAHNWELAGMTGFTAASNFATQPGITPGRWDEIGPADVGAYVPLNNATINYWLSATGRRIALVARMGSTYTNAFLGWINPFATPTQYPYPMAIIGCSSIQSRLFSASVIEMSGMVDPIAASTSGSSPGPGFCRDPGGSWRSLRNSGGAGSARVELRDLVIWPCGFPATTGLDPRDQPVLNQAYETYDIIPGSGSPGTVTFRFGQLPDSPLNRSILFPAFLIMSSPQQQVLGELPDVFWVSAFGNPTNLVSEDVIRVGNDRYRVFQNCNRTDTHAHWAMKEI